MFDPSHPVGYCVLNRFDSVSMCCYLDEIIQLAIF